jgi:NAD(P)-dependent dehydrogenase (short-subunit alcohol dehydrogenase family)
MTEKPFKGRHAVITGGATGIGAAIADRLAAMGAHLTLMARNQARLDEKAATLPAAQGVAVDVTDSASVKAAFARAREKFGSVQILINNAGAAEGKPFHKLSDEDWHRTLAVNLNGVYFCTREALADMRAAGVGRIVNVASTAGLTGYAYVVPYVAAKHGVVGLTRALALELAKTKITVNAVCPGYTETDIMKNAVDNIVAKTGRTPEQARADLTASNPQGRFVQPEEVASAVAWLCLDESASMTAQAIPVAGGEVM